MATKQTKKSQSAHQHELLENPEEIKGRLERGEAFIRKNSKIFGVTFSKAIERYC
jgi:hypothetical protein